MEAPWWVYTTVLPEGGTLVGIYTFNHPEGGTLVGNIPLSTPGRSTLVGITLPHPEGGTLVGINLPYTHREAPWWVYPSYQP